MSLRSLFSLFLSGHFTQVLLSISLGFFPDNTDAFLELESKNLENREGDWALNILQHLLIKLAGDNKFVIESYPSPQSLPLDESKGQIGDTSFGKNCVLMVIFLQYLCKIHSKKIWESKHECVISILIGPIKQKIICVKLRLFSHPSV